jgi:hypothetical protein
MFMESIYSGTSYNKYEKFYIPTLSPNVILQRMIFRELQQSIVQVKFPARPS